jgi:hypothetical protein
LVEERVLSTKSSLSIFEPIRKSIDRAFDDAGATIASHALFGDGYLVEAGKVCRTIV